ncbi:MAG: hypothetical protein AAFV53_04005 [Myxococcota bacterium]
MTMMRGIAALWVMLWSTAAHARVILKPQNQLHLGVSAVDPIDAYGLSVGMDSRLTRFIHIDVGGFASLSDADFFEPEAAEVADDYVRMRHSLWVAPGLRMPHRYGDGLNWDLFFRGGFGVVWSQDLSTDDIFLVNLAGIGGADFLLRKDRVGVRLSGKGFWYRAFPTVARTEGWANRDLRVFATQVALEAVYQW